MANIVQTTVNIGEQQLSYYSSVYVKQQIFDHDTFSLSLPSEYIEGKEGFLFQKSKDLIGQDFTVQSSVLGGGGTPLQFTGIITSIRRSRSNGYNGDIIISGAAPTILLDSGPHCKSWQKRTLADIFNEVVQHFPTNRINPQISPTFSETLDYVVQYQETAWEFLKRMCATYGEWLYYDGSSLVIGEPDKGKTEGLIFGSDLRSFDVGMSLKPVNKKVMSYDYSNTAVYSGNPNAATQKAGLDDLGNHVWKISQSTFATTPKSWDNSNMVSAGQLDDAIDLRSAMTGSSLIVFEGDGSYPGLKIGGSIHVSGSNIYSFSDEDYGNYTPISVTHQLGMNNNYTNTFVAIPASIRVPPVDAPVNPRCETQSAKVISNNDPQGMGRIQVKFHWMGGAETTPWIRVTTPHAGGGKGMYFIPEVGEEVIVGFEGDSATKPYVIGAVYNSRGNNSYGNAGNDVKALQSRSGNKVVLDDNAGSVFVEDKDGNSVMMDGAGNVTIKSNATINLICGEGDAGKSSIVMTKEGEIFMSAEKEIIMDAKKDIALSSKKISAIGSELISMGSGSGEGEAFSGSGFSLDPKNVDISAKQNLALGGLKKASLSSKTIEVGATQDTNIQGGKVNIN